MTKSQTLFEQSLVHIPGGVNSPVRAFGSVGGTPVFFQRAKGALIWDADGKPYIDYVGSWGPMILGHADSDVIDAVCDAAKNGLSFGAPTSLELEMADLLCRLLPSMDQVRLVSSGTEATMSAIRLARGYTGRSTIVKFEGCYHGHVDSLLVKAGSGALTFGNPSSAGIPEDTTRHTLVLGYNDVSQLEETFSAMGDRIAAVIVEPVAGNMNLVAPSMEFLHALRRLCTEHGAVLIFDEVMTGFRVGASCAQGLFGITPDLTTLGKVIGGGMPVGAFGGKREIMQCIAPVGPVYQAGTLSGNPVAMAAGIVTLNKATAPGFHESLAAKAVKLTEGLVSIATSHGFRFSAKAVGGMFGLYFREAPPSSYAEVMECDKTAFNKFFHFMLGEGVYFAPSAFEAGFVSGAHGDQEIDRTLQAAERYFSRA